MKKSFDSVGFMRRARERLSDEWEKKPHAEQIRYLRTKYRRLMEKKRRAGAA